MTKDQYAQLFQYMETQFTAIREDSAKQREDFRRLEINVHSDIGRLDDKIDGVERRLDGVEERLDGIEDKLQEHDERFDAIDESQNVILNTIGEDFSQHDKDLRQHKAWIEQLAEATGTELRTV